MSRKKPPISLSEQLHKERRTVDFDTFDIQTKQLTTMLVDKQIWIAPAYQRKFRWKPDQCSQLIESLLLGIPVPTLFMATNKDNTWEVVDGLQRLSTIAKFTGDKELRDRLDLKDSLVLSGLQKLTSFDGYRYSDLPATIRLHFDTRPVKVVTLNDKSDKKVRYDLFERLNKGGVPLSNQEIRDCIFVGKFSKTLDQLSTESIFTQTVKLTPVQKQDATAEECVLRFFALKNNYLNFKHSVVDFLNTYMEKASESFDYDSEIQAFRSTFQALAKIFPSGINRPSGKKTTPLALFEGIAVGAALAIAKRGKLESHGISKWLDSEELKKFTTGATNDFLLVKGRIEFCRDRFLGVKYVPATTK